MEKKDIENIALARNSMMSPYVAQGWDIKADYPNERRVVMRKEKKFSWVWFILLSLISTVVFFALGLLYLIIWFATKEEEKTLMY